MFYYTSEYLWRRLIGCQTFNSVTFDNWRLFRSERSWSASSRLSSRNFEVVSSKGVGGLLLHGQAPHIWLIFAHKLAKKEAKKTYKKLTSVPPQISLRLRSLEPTFSSLGKFPGHGCWLLQCLQKTLELFGVQLQSTSSEILTASPGSVKSECSSASVSESQIEI